MRGEHEVGGREPAAHDQDMPPRVQRGVGEAQAVYVCMKGLRMDWCWAAIYLCGHTSAYLGSSCECKMAPSISLSCVARAPGRKGAAQDGMRSWPVGPRQQTTRRARTARPSLSPTRTWLGPVLVGCV